jgi:hypothetical protein
MAAGAASGPKGVALPRQGQPGEPTQDISVRCLRPASVRLRISCDEAPTSNNRLGTVVLRDGGGEPCAYGGEVSGHYWVRIPGVGSFDLSADAREVQTSAAANASRQRVLDGYYGTALPLFAQAAMGYEVLHASAILFDGAAVAFCGSTGVGKTTIGSAFARRGFDVWSDDALAVVTRAGEAPVSVFLPFTREGEVVSAPEGREEVRLAALFLLERVDDEDIAGWQIAQPVPAEAVAGLLSHAYRFAPQSPERRRRMMETYLDLPSRVAVLSVRVAHDPDRLSHLLDDIAAKLRTRSDAPG